jgi:hypothetical protein
MERGLPPDHTTIWRWVQRYAPRLQLRRNIEGVECLPCHRVSVRHRWVLVPIAQYRLRRWPISMLAEPA